MTVTAFVFDERESEQVEDGRAALEGLADDQLLWLALRDVTEGDVAALQEALELGDKLAQRLLEPPSSASVADTGDRLHVTLYAAGGVGGEPVLVPVECVIGPNWVVTAQGEKLDVLEDFRERAAGGGQVGAGEGRHPRVGECLPGGPGCRRRAGSGGVKPTPSAVWTCRRHQVRAWSTTGTPLAHCYSTSAARTTPMRPARPQCSAAGGSL